MNGRNALFALFVLLTLVFAALSVLEYEQVQTLSSQTRSSSTTSTTSTSLGLSFPHTESQISSFCNFGQLVGGPGREDAENATGQTVTTFNIPVLVMKVPTTAYACVTYKSLVNGPAPLNYTAGENYTLPFAFSLRVCHRIGQSGMGCLPSQALSGVAFPSSIALTNSTTTFTVVYNITSTVGSTGFYDDAGDVYWGYPLAVGYQDSQLNSSDFSLVLPLGSGGGLYEPIQSTSVSVIGMDWTYVQFQCVITRLSCSFGPVGG